MRAHVLVSAIAITLFRTLAYGQVVKPTQCPVNGNYLYDVQKLLYQFVTPTYVNHQRLTITATHRGNWEVDPDNSISAFDSAFKRGDEVIESDVRLDADGHPWVIHDDVLNRQTDLVPLDPTKVEYIADTHTLTLLDAKLRDRFGNITDEPLWDLGSLLDWYYGTALCQKGQSLKPYGPVLVIDVKGTGLTDTNQYARQYYNLVETWNFIKEWHAHYNQAWGEDPGVGLVIKVHLNKVKGLHDFTQDLDLTSDMTPPTKNWNHNFLFVINPEDPGPKDWQQYQDFSPMKFTLGFELNQSTPDGPIYQKGWYSEFANYVVPEGWGAIYGDIGRSLHQYLEQDSYPEGHPTGGTCCRVLITPPFGTPIETPHDPAYTWKGYFIQFFNITDVLTVDQPAAVNGAFEVVGKRNMEAFK